MNRIGANITFAQNYAEACVLLASTSFDVAYLDHDLSELAASGQPGAEEKTGTHVAEFIAALPAEQRPRLVILHSYNPVGRQRMAGILSAAGVRCQIQPFSG